jgi:hypothetical protein
MSNITANIQKYSNVIENINQRYQDIPFGNSKWQMDSLIAAEQTPERAYRHLLINFQKRFNDLKSCSINRRKAENKVKQIQRQIEKETDELILEELSLEIEEITCGWEYENKLAKDCVVELEYMNSMIEKLPRFTKDEFEAGENEHFKLRNKESNMQLVSSIKNNLLVNKEINLIKS